MAKSLVDKLSTLVRASINDFAEGVGDLLPVLPSEQGRDLDHEVKALRGRVDDALAYEDRLDAELQKLLLQIEDLDREADAEVAAGNDARAGLLVQRLKRLQQRAAFIEADLHQHRVATDELIAQVNYLDSLVGDIKRREKAPPPPATGVDIQSTAPPEDAGEPEDAGAVEPPTVHISVTGDDPEPVRTQADAVQRLSSPETSIPKATTPVEAPQPAQTSLPQNTSDSLPKPPASPSPAPSDAPMAKQPASETPESRAPQRYRVPEGLVVDADVGEAPEAKPKLPEVQRLAEALRKARQSVEQAEGKMDAADAWKAQIEAGTDTRIPEVKDEGPSKEDVDADLAARRARLSKPE